ncbi:MAG: S41 family peptidase [Planctomycetales bacterium]|nr:S41 family peptidase [Planctomycetales bacterium]
MPQRNQRVIVAVVLLSLICYVRADASQRGRFGPMLDTMFEVLYRVDANYVEPVDRRELFEGAISGIMAKLDPYSAYISPQRNQQLQEELDQEFGGIGIQILNNDPNEPLTVLSPLVGTPAYNAGILADDKIIGIDGESTAGFTADDAVDLLRGKPGEKVVLTVLHPGSDTPVDVEIERDVIEIETVLGDRHSDTDGWTYTLAEHPEIGYVRLNSFSKKTVDELTAVLKQLEADGAQGLILDLRNNPGGLLTAATEVCDLFLDSGLIVSTRGRDGDDDEVFEATPGGYTDIPLVILINGFSASASEIVSACLQDHGRAIVVGERSWGKGSVQNVIPLLGERGESSLKLTTATYWRPSGKNIHRSRTANEDDEWGVRPNEGFEVKLDETAFTRLMEDRRERDVILPHTNGEAPTELAAEVVAEVEPAGPAPNDAASEQKPGVVDPQLQLAVEYLINQIATTTDV